MKFKLLPLLFLLPNFLIAQTPKNISGYYINAKGDSIIGSFPEYRDWTHNPNEVKFKPVNSGTIILTPTNCTSFHVDNYDTYISYSGPRMINTIEFNSTSIDQNDSTSQYENIISFLRIIFSYGDFKILIFQDKDRVNFFYMGKDNSPTELIYKTYSSTENDFITVPTYQQQLKTMFADKIFDKNLENTVNELAYKEDDIVNLMKKIYQVPKEKISKTSVYKTSVFISAGIAANFFKVVGDNSYAQVSTKFNTSFSPVLTIGMYLPIKRNFGKFCISPQLSIYTYSNEGSYNYSIYGGAHYTHDMYKASFLLIPKLYFTYKIIATNDIECNTGLGVGLGLVNGANETFTDSTYFVTTQNNKDVTFVPTFNCQTAFIVKKRIEFLINYSLPAVVTNDNNYSGKHSSLQFTAGWKF